MEDLEGLVGGAPCTPWASNGKQEGIADPVEECFNKVVELIVEQCHRPHFLFYTLENSANILRPEKKGQRQAYAKRVLLRLTAAAPHYLHEIVIVDNGPDGSCDHEGHARVGSPTRTIRVQRLGAHVESESTLVEASLEQRPLILCEGNWVSRVDGLGGAPPILYIISGQKGAKILLAPPVVFWPPRPPLCIISGQTGAKILLAPPVVFWPPRPPFRMRYYACLDGHAVYS